MRFIASCPECHTQYWSDEKETRQSLNCYCGNTIQLKPPSITDARVVRCASCGAPREQGASACKFCHSDFTVYEKDLNTICPHCMARISDSSKFCQYCGVKISPQFSMGKRSGMNCPACEDSKPLFLRNEPDQLAFHECHICAGVWLSQEAFETFIKNSQSEEVSWLLGQLPQPKNSVVDLRGEAGPQSRFYRPCPTCQATMNRHNVANRSGVIVDFCSKHGVWFDGNELAQLVEWIRGGGLERAAEQSQQRQRTVPFFPEQDPLSKSLLHVMSDLMRIT